VREKYIRKVQKLKRKKKMSDVQAAADAAPSQDEFDLVMKKKNSGILEIRAYDGTTGKLEIYFRHPLLAEVISKMTLGNYPIDQFDPVYKPILMEHPNPAAKGRAATRPAIYTTTKNFEAQPDFSFNSPPRGVLISNPHALREGFSLIVELKTPVPNDTLRKWGKQLMDGCTDIISASRPFKMSWVMTESTPGKL
jgi:hypothetical protein